MLEYSQPIRGRGRGCKCGRENNSWNPDNTEASSEQFQNRVPINWWKVADLKRGNWKVFNPIMNNKKSPRYAFKSMNTIIRYGTLWHNFNIHSANRRTRVVHFAVVDRTKEQVIRELLMCLAPFAFSVAERWRKRVLFWTRFSYLNICITKEIFRRRRWNQKQRSFFNFCFLFLSRR